ncbi:MAG: restriction endonuclease, partial [Pseudomonadota bacterium]
IEMIVAGINRILIPTADVEWNAIRNKRQFDVLATVGVGPYRVLIAFEVKHKKRKISVDTIDAFVTKAKDLGAQKAVIVSTSGFQIGCKSVAKKHSIDLFTLKFSSDSKPSLAGKAFLVFQNSGRPAANEMPEFYDEGEELGNVIEHLWLHYADGTKSEVPNEPSQMQYYVQNTKTKDGATLEEIVLQQPAIEQTRDNSERCRITVDTDISPPDKYAFRAGTITEIEFEVAVRVGRVVTGNMRIEPSSFPPNVIYRDITTDTSFTTPVNHLPVGPNRLEAGSFYFSYYPLRYYYCDSINDEDMMRLILVESFQNGQLFQIGMRQRSMFSRFYLPVLDASILKRLQSRLDTWQATMDEDDP